MSEIEKVLREVEARLKAATPGPWRKGQWLDKSQGPMHWNVFADDTQCTVVVDTIPCDAELIAHAPDDLRRLIAALRKADEALAKCQTAAGRGSILASQMWAREARAELARILRGG